MILKYTCGTARFFLFWACMIILWFKTPMLSASLSILMLSTIRARKSGERTYELQYGLIPILRRWRNGKENN